MENGTLKIRNFLVLAHLLGFLYIKKKRVYWGIEIILDMIIRYCLSLFNNFSSQNTGGWIYAFLGPFYRLMGG